jgi:hypothetical protein
MNGRVARLSIAISMLLWAVKCQRRFAQRVSEARRVSAIIAIIAIIMMGQFSGITKKMHLT